MSAKQPRIAGAKPAGSTLAGNNNSAKPDFKTPHTAHHQQDRCGGANNNNSRKKPDQAVYVPRARRRENDAIGQLASARPSVSPPPVAKQEFIENPAHKTSPDPQIDTPGACGNSQSGSDPKRGSDPPQEKPIAKGPRIQPQPNKLPMQVISEMLARSGMDYADIMGSGCQQKPASLVVEDVGLHVDSGARYQESWKSEKLASIEEKMVPDNETAPDHKTTPDNETAPDNQTVPVAVILPAVSKSESDSILEFLPKSYDEFESAEWSLGINKSLLTSPLLSPKNVESSPSVLFQHQTKVNQGGFETESCPSRGKSVSFGDESEDNSPSPDLDDLEVQMINESFEEQQKQQNLYESSELKQLFYSLPNLGKADKEKVLQQLGMAKMDPYEEKPGVLQPGMVSEMDWAILEAARTNVVMADNTTPPTPKNFSWKQPPPQVPYAEVPKINVLPKQAVPESVVVVNCNSITGATGINNNNNNGDNNNNNCSSFSASSVSVTVVSDSNSSTFNPVSKKEDHSAGAAKLNVTWAGWGSNATGVTNKNPAIPAKGVKQRLSPPLLDVGNRGQSNSTVSTEHLSTTMSSVSSSEFSGSESNQNLSGGSASCSGQGQSLSGNKGQLMAINCQSSALADGEGDQEYLAYQLSEEMALKVLDDGDNNAVFDGDTRNGQGNNVGSETKRKCVDTKVVRDEHPPPSTIIESDQQNRDTPPDETNFERVPLEKCLETADLDSWEDLLDEQNSALDPKALQEINLALGKVKVETPKFDYYAYAPREISIDDAALPHVLEISKFASSPGELNHLLVQARLRDFAIEAVDENHALIVFSNVPAAKDALDQNHVGFSLLPLSLASAQSKKKAIANADTLAPYRARPAKSALLARRLVESHLGKKSAASTNQRAAERQRIRLAKEDKEVKARLRENAWEGSL